MEPVAVGRAPGAGRPRRAAPVPARHPDPQDALRAHAGLLRRLAVTTALLAGIAAAGEVFRYVLLVLSRDRALSGVALGWSDVLVTLFGLLAPVAGLATGVVFLRWLLAARALAAEESGTRPWRSTRLLLLGCVLPPFTLTVPGSTLAEIEHAGGGSDPAVRPTPSRPVLVWWASWATGVVLGVVTVAHGFATSTQALADGVVLHALVDVVAIVTAVATVRVVAHLTELLAPVLRPAGRAWVVRAAAA